MQRDKLWGNLLSVLLITTFLLVACGETGELESVTVTFGCYDYEWEAYEKLAAKFEADNPGISVQLVSLDEITEQGSLEGWSDDSWQRLAAAADTAVFSLYPGATGRGLLRDLSELINADPDFHPEDFYPNTLESFQRNGGIWALPVGVNLHLVYYDKDAFDAAAVFYPTPGWMWDDFLTKAKALTEREGERVTRYGCYWGPGLAQAYLLDHAGPLLDEHVDPPLPRLDRPEVAQAAQWYIDLVELHQVTPYFPPDQKYIERMQFLHGKKKAAMWSDSSASMHNWEQFHNLGLAPYPSDGRDTNYFSTRGYMMSAGTLHPQESWRWLRFLTRQPPPGSGDLIPPRRSVAEEIGYWDGLDPEVAQIYRYALEHSQIPIGRTRVVLDAFSEAIHTVLQGEKGLETALAEAQMRANERLGARIESEKITPIPVTTPRPEQPTGSTIVTFAPFVGYGDFKVDAFRELAEEFNRAHPDVKVEIRPAAMGAQPSGIAEAAEQVDCFAWFPILKSADERAAILALDSFIDADPTFDLDDFYRQFLAQFRQKGRLWGLPAEGWPRLMYYNKALFDAAGVAYPTLDWTLDDFLVKAKALTQGEGDTKQYGFVPEQSEVNDLTWFTYQQGGRLIDESVDPVGFLYDAPATVAAVRRYVDLSRIHGVKPALQGVPMTGPGSGWERSMPIRDGRAAMWSGYGKISPHDPWAELETGVAPLPQGKRNVVFTTVLGYFISAETDVPGACWEWLVFLSKQASPVQGMPARRSLAESAAFRQQVGEEVAAAYLAAVQGDSSLSAGLGPWASVPTFWFAQAYDAIVREDVDAEVALAEVQTKAEAYRTCIATHGRFDDEETWKKCAIQVDPGFPVQSFE